MNSARPAISVVLVTEDSYEKIAIPIQYLARQTVADQMEIILVGPSIEKMQIDYEALQPFGSYQILEVAEFQSSGTATFEALKIARAPLFAYHDQHSYPEPRVFEYVLRSFAEGNYDVVGWAVTNANPGLVSWSQLYGEFGVGVAPVVSGLKRRNVGHHNAYRVDQLWHYGDKLQLLLSNEIAMQLDMTARGCRLYLMGEATSSHLNLTVFSVACHLDYMGQRGFASSRALAGNWSLGRRLLYAAASPLYPMLRTLRAIGHIIRTGRALQLLGTVPWVILLTTSFGAIGEAMGYLFGPNSQSERTRLTIEVDRFQFVNDQDIRAIKDTARAA